MALNQAVAQKFEERQEMLEMSLESFAALIALAVVAFLSASLLQKVFPVIPHILWVTTFSIVLAQSSFVKKYKGSEILGSYTVLIFFVTLGAICDVKEMINIGVYLFCFTMIIVSIHGVWMVLVGKLFKLPIETLLLSSQACIGGAPSAVSLAKVLGLKKYLASSALIGVVGYAIGNYLGVLIGYLVKVMM